MAKRKQVKNACIHCQRACKRCDDIRPCSRCIKYDLASSCIDSPRKERKTKLKAYKISSAVRTSKLSQATLVSDENTEPEIQYSNDLTRDEASFEYHTNFTITEEYIASIALNKAMKNSFVSNCNSTVSEINSFSLNSEKEYLDLLRKMHCTKKTIDYNDECMLSVSNNTLQECVLKPGMEMWDLAIAAASANNSIEMIQQFKTMSRASNFLEAPNQSIQTSPIIVLASVCAEILETELIVQQYVNLLSANNLYLKNFSSIDLHESLSSSRLPTPPETPLPWLETNRQMQFQQNYSAQLLGHHFSPIKLVNSDTSKTIDPKFISLLSHVIVPTK